MGVAAVKHHEHRFGLGAPMDSVCSADECTTTRGTAIVHERGAGRAVQDGLDPERLRQAMFQHLRNYGLRPHKCNELCAPELADEYVAAPPSKPVHGEVDRL